MQRKWLGVILLFVQCAHFPLLAESSRPPASRSASSRSRSSLSRDTSEFRYNVVQLSFFGVMQDYGGGAVSAEVSYNPSYQFSTDWSAQLNLGLSGLKKQSGGVVPLLDYEALGFYHYQRFSLGLGGGAQTWIGLGGTSLVGTTRFAFALTEPLRVNGWELASLRYLFIQYSALLHSSSTTEIKLGAGLAL